MMDFTSLLPRQATIKLGLYSTYCCFLLFGIGFIIIWGKVFRDYPQAIGKINLFNILFIQYSLWFCRKFVFEGVVSDSWFLDQVAIEISLFCRNSLSAIFFTTQVYCLEPQEIIYQEIPEALEEISE